MAKSDAVNTTAKKLSKKETVQLVMHKLEPVLVEYKERFGKKKFESRLKKASKLFAPAVDKKGPKQNKLKEVVA